MEIFFNELSCNPLAKTKDEARKRALDLVVLLAEAKKNGFGIMRCPDKGCSEIKLFEDYTIADVINENVRDPKSLLLLSMIHQPYFRADTEEEARYINSDFVLEMSDVDGSNKIFKPYGLAAALIKKSLCLNITSDEKWINNKVYVLKEKSENKNYQVFAFSNPEDFNSDFFIQWKVYYQERNFLKRNDNVKNKICNLSSDHHGNNILEDFAKKSLFILPYISGVVTSLEYTKNSKSFVKRVDKKSNRLEVVLHWTEFGLGMVVQTTAKDEVELLQIADELEKKFGKKA